MVRLTQAALLHPSALSALSAPLVQRVRLALFVRSAQSAPAVQRYPVAPVARWVPWIP